MMIRLFVVLILFAGFSSYPAAQAGRGSLFGWVVVLDPGHGGQDPGSSGNFSGQRVVEDEYTYDVALRVARIVKARGGIAVTTITDSVGERNWEPRKVFPDLRTERFAQDQTIVRAGTSGLNKRLDYGNQISRRYPKHRQAWISIHFDVLGTNRVIDGVRIITPDLDMRLAKALSRTFGDAQRLRDDNPLVVNGDRGVGMRKLYVLTSRNRIRERVLVELGNFNNEADVWRIRNYQVRDAYVGSIVKALETW